MDYINNLSNIMMQKKSLRKRISSYDVTGGNDDSIIIKSKEKKVIANIEGAGIINHIWMTHRVKESKSEPYSLRKIIIRMYWENNDFPSVEVPLGDFFGMGLGLCKNFVSAPLQMSPENGKAFNCWWPMPFRKNAKIEIENECDSEINLYYYIDYETYQSLPEDMLYFHATWNRTITTGKDEKEFASHDDWLYSGKNVTGKDNYVILETTGKGHYCGCNLNIQNLNPTDEYDWPGEGDDMIFIDGESWPPRIHGTGTEDYINTAWSPKQEYNAPYHGIILAGGDNWKDKITYYRYHIQDPITFEKSIKVTIEHGHNNNRSDDYSSTAYWYQDKPVKPWKELLKTKDRLPTK